MASGIPGTSRFGNEAREQTSRTEHDEVGTFDRGSDLVRDRRRRRPQRERPYRLLARRDALLGRGLGPVVVLGDEDDARRVDGNARRLDAQDRLRALDRLAEFAGELRQDGEEQAPERVPAQERVVEPVAEQVGEEGLGGREGARQFRMSPGGSMS